MRGLPGRYLPSGSAAMLHRGTTLLIGMMARLCGQNTACNRAENVSALEIALFRELVNCEPRFVPDTQCVPFPQCAPRNPGLSSQLVL